MRNIRNKTWQSVPQKPLLLLLAFLLCLGVLMTGTAVAQDDPPPAADEFPLEHPDFPGIYILNREETGNIVETTLAIRVLQDTFLSSGNPNTNYGTSTSLNIGWSNNSNLNAMRFILQFQLSAIPANATINNATFNIYQFNSVPSNDSDFGIQAQFMRQPWGENTVTWNNANFLGSEIIGVGFTNNAAGWKVFDATQVVTTWYSGQRPNYGAIFTGDERSDQNRSRAFYSKEQGNIPTDCGNPFNFGCSSYLVVTYNEANCDNIAPTVSVQPLPQWSPQSFTVSWSGSDTAPPGCPPTGIANYSVQYRLNNGAWTDWQNFTTATSAVFNLAGNGQFVQFRSRARDGNGNVIPWENIGPQASTTVDAVPPNATMNPLPEFSTNSGTVTWSGSDNLSGISTYNVQFRVNGGPWEFLVQNAPASQTSFAYSGAPPGFFELRASATDNAGNVQPWGDPQASTTIVGYPVADMNPISPSIITNPGQTTIPLSWTVYPNGYAITSVQIWYKYGLGNWVSFNIFPGSSGNASFPINNGDGVYSFEAVALTTTVSEPQSGQAEASVIVDQVAPFVVPQAYMPIIFQTTE